jgi:hypothetical protein
MPWYLISKNAPKMCEIRGPSITKLECGVAALALLLVTLALFALSLSRSDGHYGSVKAMSNCRQIILSMRLYAADNAGAYPDAKHPSAMDSNTVFKQLILDGSLEDENIFGCPGSPYQPDRNIGVAPDYDEAILPGENHWAMTKGLDDASPGSVPLIFENPAEATWPPKWNPDAVDTPVKGRAWKKGFHCVVIVGLNDTSVERMVLSRKSGAKVPLAEGKDPFASASRASNAPKYDVLDVAVKK